MCPISQSKSPSSFVSIKAAHHLPSVPIWPHLQELSPLLLCSSYIWAPVVARICPEPFSRASVPVQCELHRADPAWVLPSNQHCHTLQPLTQQFLLSLCISYVCPHPFLYLIICHSSIVFSSYKNRGAGAVCFVYCCILYTRPMLNIE